MSHSTRRGGIIDKTVRSRRCGEVGYDAGKKIKGRRRFLSVDTLGYLLGLHTVAADTHERKRGQGELFPIH